jgi:hypothetical protein
MTDGQSRPAWVSRAIKDHKDFLDYARQAATILKQRGRPRDAAFYWGMASSAALVVSYLVDELGDQAEGSVYLLRAQAIQRDQLDLDEVGKILDEEGA